jgi:hypothetical protein
VKPVFPIFRIIGDEGKIEGRRKGGRSRKQLLGSPKEKRKYWDLK